MRDATLLTISLLSTLALSACRKGEVTDCNLTANYCSCDRRSETQYPDCRDYEAMSADSAASDCSDQKGTFTKSSLCPTESVVGTCKFTRGTEITYQRYYSSSYANAAAGAAVCTYYKANCFVISGNAVCDATWTTP